MVVTCNSSENVTSVLLRGVIAEVWSACDGDRACPSASDCGFGTSVVDCFYAMECPHCGVVSFLGDGSGSGSLTAVVVANMTCGES